MRLGPAARIQAEQSCPLVQVVPTVVPVRCIGVLVMVGRCWDRGGLGRILGY